MSEWWAALSALEKILTAGIFVFCLESILTRWQLSRIADALEKKSGANNDK